MRGPLCNAWLRRRHGRRRGSSRERIESLIEQILEACHPAQRAYVVDEAKQFAALTSGRAGKTTGSRARLLIKGLRIRRARLLFVAQTRDQAEDLIWGALKELCERLGIGFQANETKLILKLTDTGSIIRLVGADDRKEIEKLRGRPWHEVIIDEAASHSPRLLENLIVRVIGPRLGDYDGCIGMVGTPGHVLNGLFYDVTRRNATVEGWSVHRWNLEEGARHVAVMKTAWAVALRKKSENGWSDSNPIWRREYLGEWASDDASQMYTWHPHVDVEIRDLFPERELVDGQPWNLWSPERDANGWAVLPAGFTDWRHVVGMDMGHGTPFALEVLAFSPSDKGRNIYQRYEFHRLKMYAKKIAELLIGEALDVANPAPTSVIGIIGWPDAMIADLANLGDAIVLELGDVYGITIGTADKKNKPGSVELMNGDLLEGRMHVLERSELAAQMAGLQWRVDEHGILREPKHGDDACDGCIYPRREIAKMFEPERPPQQPAIPRRADRILEDENKDFAPKRWDELLSSGYYDEQSDGF